MPMIRRRMALLTVAALLCGMLAGCQVNDDPAPVPSPEYQTPVAPEGAIDPTSEEAGYALLYAEELEPAGTPASDRLGGFGLIAADNPGLPYDFACHIGADGAVTGVLPAGLDLSAAIPTFYYSGQVLLDGQPLVSGQTPVDLTAPRTLTLVDGTGAQHTATVDVQTLYTGLPSVALTVEDLTTISSKTEFRSCTLYVGGGDPACCPYAAAEPVTVTAKARGRGNTSWEQDKKGYSINLDHTAGLLDMPTARKWALVANYEDKTLLRNYVAYELTEQVGLDAVLSVRPVDLWYNGTYWGTYNLCERVSINEARVNITEQEDISGLDPSEVAYLFEFDGHVSEVNDRQRRGWKVIGGSAYYDPVTGEDFLPVPLGEKWITVKQPEHDQFTAEIAKYVSSLIHTTCDALKAADWETIDAQMDVTSFVRWYMVEEFMNNTDSSMHSSVFMYRDVGGKFVMGPPWDFDRSSGNCDYWNTKNEPDSLYTSTAGWFSYMFQCEEARALLKSEWASFSEKIATIGETVDRDAAMLSVSQQYNFKRWDILEKKVGANPREVVRAHTYEEQVTILRDYLTERLGAMDTFIQGLS